MSMHIARLAESRRRPLTPLLTIAAAFVAAGGVIHLREWLDVYRYVPASIPGAVVVRAGFPINAAVSMLLAAGLIGVVVLSGPATRLVVWAAVAFEAGSLGTLIASRTGSVFGWMEPGWSAAASQTRAVEIGALLTLSAVLVTIALGHPVAAVAVGGSPSRAA